MVWERIKMCCKKPNKTWFNGNLICGSCGYVFERLKETPERRTSIPPTNKLVGILEVIL